MLLNELLALARATRAVDDPLIRQQLAQVFIEVEMTKLHNWRTLTQLRRHGKPGPESSLVKLFWSEMSQRLHDTAMQVLGVDGQYWPGEARAVARGRWLRSYLYYRAATIFAGTSEVQRNIIAQRVLGLPR
jgi:alkylation response protein AidB-like acyl-CoA dehydrogenase